MTAPASSWRADAACLHSSADTFHPSGPSSTIPALIAAAKAICARCPVAEDCLDYALSLGTGAEGVWGATDERERRTIAAERQHAHVARVEAARIEASRLAARGIPTDQIANGMGVSARTVHRYLADRAAS